MVRLIELQARTDADAGEFHLPIMPEESTTYWDKTKFDLQCVIYTTAWEKRKARLERMSKPKDTF